MPTVLGNLLTTPAWLKSTALSPFQIGLEPEQSGSSAAKLLEQPLAAVDYSEANSQADQDYDRTSEKELLHHNSYSTSA